MAAHLEQLGRVLAQEQLAALARVLPLALVQALELVAAQAQALAAQVRALEVVELAQVELAQALADQAALARLETCPHT